jgi:hypothetical protein
MALEHAGFGMSGVPDWPTIEEVREMCAQFGLRAYWDGDVRIPAGQPVIGIYRTPVGTGHAEYLPDAASLLDRDVVGIIEVSI